MPFVAQPAFTHLPAYRPVKFEVVVPTLTVNPVENALVTIFKDFANVTPNPIVYKSSRKEPGGVPTATDYYFEIDIASFIQDLQAPNRDFPTTMPVGGVQPGLINKENYADYFIVVTYEVISSITGELVSIGVPEISNTYTVFSASRENGEDMSMEDYLGTTPVTPDRLFLTKSARVLDVCASDNAFLSMIQANNAFNTNSYRVDFFDSAGALLFFGVGFVFPNVVNAGQWTLNTGLEALATTVWLPTGSPLPVLPDPAIASYTVRFGNLQFNVGIYSVLIQSETFTYNVIGECCGLRELRFHWTNLLGGTDSYTFNSEKDLRIETQNDTGKKALKWIIGDTAPNDPSDFGKMKLRSKGMLYYALKSKILSNADAKFLSGILYNPKVYAEIDGNLISVYVRPTNQSITRERGKIPFEIIAELSQDLIIPRI